MVDYSKAPENIPWKIYSLPKKTIENNCGEIEKDDEAMGKSIKDLTLSYMDKLGVLWDDKKRKKIWLLNWMIPLGRKSSWRWSHIQLQM